MDCKTWEASGFHSTDFPYERGHRSEIEGIEAVLSFHSTDFPYERGPREEKEEQEKQARCFHSTDFPYERGLVIADVTDGNEMP